MKKSLQAFVATLFLLLATLPAWALGLGQIQVKSRMNEPFLAVIPVVSNDPAELQELQARLADPETFIRIGLPLPDKLVSDLQFAVITGDDGQPAIRVTSQDKVTQPVIDFLVEVQWSDGRLVREYSALVATPNAVAAAEQPIIQAPAATTGNIIQRPVAPQPADQPLPPHQGRVAPATTIPSPSTTRVPPPESTSAPAANGPQPSGKDFGPVRTGQTLSEIAAAMAAQGMGPAQVMDALVQLNPEAFIGGDPNRLKAGAVLRIPDGANAIAADAVAARSVARAATAALRESRVTAPKAVNVATVARPRAVAPATKPTPLGEAHLQIVAPTGDSPATATQSGRGNQGEGDMLQQVQQAQETVAARDAEIHDLKSRVADLEQMQQKQAQLIAMKDSQLAAAQQHVAKGAPPPAAPAASMGAPWGWLVAGALLLALVALGAWRLFRSTPAATGPGSRGTPGGRPSPVWQKSDAPSLVPAVTVPAVPDEPKQPDNGLPSWARDSAWIPGGSIVAPAVMEASAPQDGYVADILEGHLALAQAYLDTGDSATARTLLDGVIRDGDEGQRARAASLLAGLG